MLVRMTWDKAPIYVSNENIESIRSRGGVGEHCFVQYLDGRERMVDGTPDEVFKALLNPPEMVLKEDVEKAMRTIESLFSEASRGRGSIFGAERFIADIRDSLGLGKRR